MAAMAIEPVLAVGERLLASGAGRAAAGHMAGKAADGGAKPGAPEGAEPSKSPVLDALASASANINPLLQAGQFKL